MRCIQVSQPGSSDQLKLEDCPIPHYGPNDVLIKMKAAGINYIDIYMRNGSYKPPHYPYTPGKEGSGVVEAVGENVKDLKPGDRVAFFAGAGSYAEYTTLLEDQVVKIPTSLSFEVAAAIMLQGLTAYYLSHLTFKLTDKHTALVHAGAGGVGTLLIQMAKNLGAFVITTVSSEEKAKIAKNARADKVINYTEESFLQRTLELTQGKGVNVVYDGIGKTTFNDSLSALAIRGLLASFGQASGPVPPLDLSKLAEKSSFITRPSIFHYAQTKEELQSMSTAVFEIIQAGKLDITIGQVYPLAEAAKAHEDLESRKTIGKSILII